MPQPRENLPYSPENSEDLDEIRNYLSEEDEVVLGRGLQKLWEIFSAFDEKDLPTDIIFPDTGARPLLYAVKPLLDFIYSSRQKKPPAYHFIVTHSNRNDVEHLALIKKKLQYERDELDDNSRESEIEFQDILKENLTMQEITRHPSQLNDPQTLLSQNNLRLFERILKISHNGTHRMFIIDDFMDKGETLSQIQEAYSDLDINYGSKNTKEIPMLSYYSFFQKKNSPILMKKTLFGYNTAPALLIPD